MSKQSQINWKRGDYIKLGRAVSQFNKKINELNKEENKLYLPDTIIYKDIKLNITTRNEFNRVINSLRRFGREGAEELYVTQAGEQITVWERRELGIQKGIAKRRLKQELQSLNEPTIGNFSKAQMGSLRVREIEAQLKNLETIEQKTGYEFNKLRNRIKNVGTSDYLMRKSLIFRNNFMRELKNLKINNSEFEKVYEYFESISNPITFFETTQKSNALQDFFEWYQNPEAYGNFSDEELANYIINEYTKEIETKDNQEIEKDDYKKKKYKYSLVARDGIIIASSDSLQTLRNMAFNSKESQIANAFIIKNY